MLLDDVNWRLGWKKYSSYEALTHAIRVSQQILTKWHRHSSKP